MSDIFWPGDERAGELFSAESFVAAMVRVELAWLQALTVTGLAPALDVDRLEPALTDQEVALVSAGSEAGGNPVLGLVRILRERLAPYDPAAATWLHRGLTSQDVVDTGLMLCLRDVLDRLRGEFTDQVGSLSRLADTHRDTLMVGRTLTQSAVPITFGLKAATWMQGVLDAAESAERVRAGLVSQFGGAAGTMAATAELAAVAGLPDPPRQAEAVAAQASHLLGLSPTAPWHTARGPITTAADALVQAAGAWGRIGTDVITLSRPEIAEVSEPAAAGRGGSSTMPQKHNPILSVLVRRAALSAPMLGAQLHLAAADTGDERPAGAWHTEWAALRTLARQTATAASQTSELLAGLDVHPAKMLATLQDALPGVLAERIALHRSAGPVPDDVPDRSPDRLLEPRDYLGTAALTIDSLLARAGKSFPGENR